MAVQTTTCHDTVYGWILPPQAYADVQIGNRVLHELASHFVTELTGIIKFVDEENRKRAGVAADAAARPDHDGSQQQRDSDSDSSGSEGGAITLGSLLDVKDPSTSDHGGS